MRVIEAKGLLVRRPKESKPYCVVQFESNEFVTKEATVVHDPETAEYERKDPVWKHEAVLYDLSLRPSR